ncbi:MAG: bifunctional phosphoserine phosphatase/homoserine phosphotransferase ThrH [Methylococcales bacterium]|jgi:phosphoserine/homoserine phosphotransferase|nr:bifunctional phosphoserine phosphatase/homoserine phosphotransferase ThrH [Methylococcales bacterium]MBT7411367.1 bifunctional phosphoserine phosphatase/homoserine phosphotransferase ThrH [Methylococcales bacterium]
MELVCLDLEGVLVPEIWIDFANVTGIDALKATTRDISDYDELMKMRLSVLDEHNLGINEIQEVISSMAPMDGAKAFLDDIRSRYQCIILSDTFSDFARPLMKQLDWPTLFCHQLVINNGKITNYQLRLKDHKRKAVEAFKALNFNTVAAGDSYNDTSMLNQADQGILFCPPQNVIDEFPQFPVVKKYADLTELINKHFLL